MMNRMSTGHSPLNIKSIIFTNPALCDILFYLLGKLKISRMSTGHSPLNITSIIFTNPALCDILFYLMDK